MHLENIFSANKKEKVLVERKIGIFAFLRPTDPQPEAELDEIIGMGAFTNFYCIFRKMVERNNFFFF